MKKADIDKRIIGNAYDLIAFFGLAALVILYTVAANVHPSQELASRRPHFVAEGCD